jgi:hypothetical protein
VNEKLKRIWKEVIVPNFKVLPLHSPGGTEENHENSQDNQSLGQDLKPGPSEYESGWLTITFGLFTCITRTFLKMFSESYTINTIKHYKEPTWKVCFPCGLTSLAAT